MRFAGTVRGARSVKRSAGAPPDRSAERAGNVTAGAGHAEGRAVRLRGLCTVSFWADDVAAAAAWYAQFLGVEAYFTRPGPDGRLAYAEFRIGDYQAELGIIDRGYAPPGAAAGPGGAIAYWHVDDLASTVDQLMSMGAT